MGCHRSIRRAERRPERILVLRNPLPVRVTGSGGHCGSIEPSAFLSGRRAVVKNLSEGTFTGELIGEGLTRLTRVGGIEDEGPRDAPIVVQERIDSPVEPLTVTHRGQ